MSAQTYAYFFEKVNSDTSINEYQKVLHSDAKFKDPFHEVVGIEKIYDIFQEMYKKLDNPQFKIKEIIEQKNIAYIKWDFEYKFKNTTKVEFFEGVSRVEFDDLGKAISHIDYWDAAQHVYEKIPVLSSILKFIKRKINS